MLQHVLSNPATTPDVALRAVYAAGTLASLMGVRARVQELVPLLPALAQNADKDLSAAASALVQYLAWAVDKH